MLTMMTSILISFILPIIVMLIATILSKNLIYGREKNHHLNAVLIQKHHHEYHSQFDFFLIAVIFLIYDVGIALILPIIIIMKTSNITVWTIATMFFICILVGGLFHEWNQGALKWAD